MKFLVRFEENATVRRIVEAVVEADTAEAVESAIEDGNFEVTDCEDCYDVDNDFIKIDRIEPYD